MTETEQGIIRTSTGWAAAKVVRKGGVEAKRRLLAGPYTGTGAKLRAIQAAGTNKVIA